MRTKALAAGFAVAVAGILGATALALPLGSSAKHASDTIPGIVDIYTKLNVPHEAAAGTGIVLTSSGEILTNNHVIRGATSIHVTVLDTHKSYKATVIGYSLANDIAVIQLASASGIPTATLGGSGSVKTGASVTGYGNAGGAGGAPSVAPGKVISLNRSLQVSDDQNGSEQLHGLIETNAPLQPGDSGGPLVNGNGKVIGIDTAASSSFTFESGVTRGFAIPINHAKVLAAQIVAGQKSTAVHIGKTAFLGVGIQPPNDFFGQATPGLFVLNVTPGSPTARAGILPNDVITRFDGRAVNSVSQLTALIVTKYPGDLVPLRWIDEVGSVHKASVKLAAGPPQ